MTSLTAPAVFAKIGSAVVPISLDTYISLLAPMTGQERVEAIKDTSLAILPSNLPVELTDMQKFYVAIRPSLIKQILLMGFSDSQCLDIVAKANKGGQPNQQATTGGRQGNKIKNKKDKEKKQGKDVSQGQQPRSN